jgi:tRNA (pseudouridine54-N1)-methyltransferase
MRRFVILGAKATASAEFLLADLPGTSGRLDVLLRCLRAALLISHGLRRDAVVYLVLGGGPRAPRSLRVDGAAAKYLRPDERSLAVLAKKALDAHRGGAGFEVLRPGVAVADGGLDGVLADVGRCPRYVLDEGGADVRGVELPSDAVFFLGDHQGFAAGVRESLGAVEVSVGPVSLHAEDVVAVLSNELDRREYTAAKVCQR